MRQYRFLLFVVSFSLLRPLPAGATKLHGQLQVVRQASPKKLRALGRYLAVHPDRGTTDVTVRLRPGATIAGLRRAHPAFRFGTQAGPIVTAEVPIARLDDLEADPDVEIVEQSRRLKPNLDAVRSTLTNSGEYLGILEASNDLAAADGTGVIVAVIDTGVDYSHKDFNITGGAPAAAPYNTRLLSIWDQCDTDPNFTLNCSHTNTHSPGGFGYGLECTPGGVSPTGINNGTCTERDYNGHGSNVMGIAAGNGRATGNSVPQFKYTGIAKGASLIMVRSDLTDNHVIDAMNYIVGKAGATPVVMNMSFGGQSGPHDGTDNLEAAVAGVAASHPIAIAMGNDDLDAPHAQFTIQPGNFHTTTVNTCTTSGSACYNEFVDTEFWFNSGDFYNIQVCIAATGDNSCVSYSPGAFGQSQSFAVDSITGRRPSVTVSTFQFTGASTGILVYFDDAGDGAAGDSIQNVSYKLTRTATGGNGVVDGYTQPAILGTSFATDVAAYGTMGRPSTANNVFSIGAYVSKNTWPLDNASPYDSASNGCLNPESYAAPLPTLGDKADFSARGPTRDGRQKPDIVAPGEGIASSLSLASTPQNCFVVDDGVHFLDQGTSQATPVATGVMAVLLQVFPTLTVNQIHAALQNSARADGLTLAGGSLPSYKFGYGKIVGAPLKVRAAPGSLSQTVLGTSSITFNWSLVANATSWNLRQAQAPNAYVQSSLTNSLTLTGLSANTLYSYEAAGVNGYGEGPAGPVFLGSTLASPPNLVGIVPGVNNILVQYSAGAGGASGFSLFATTAPDAYTGTLFMSSTTDGGSANLTVGGLAPGTKYYLRLGAFNQGGVQTFALIGSATTGTAFSAPPITASPSANSSTQIQFFWGAGANPPSTNYSASISASPTFSPLLQTIQGVDQFTAFFNGLSPNTSYYLEVQANTGPFSSTGPFATQAGLPTAANPPFGVVTPNSVTVNWGAGPNPGGTLYQVQVSTDPTAAFYPIAGSAQTTALSASVAGLNGNTVYYARVQAFNWVGIPTSFVALGSTSTLALPPAPQPSTNQILGGFTVNFTNGGNAAGTTFVARLSVNAGFSPVLSSVQTGTSLSASFSGLAPNQQYFFDAGAISNSGAVNYGASLSTFTIPVPPVATSPAASNQTPVSLRFHWADPSNAAGTTYTAQLSPGGATVAGTGNLFADFAGLAPDTPYTASVQALHQGASNQDSAFITAGSASTLANAPPGATVVLPVSYSSITVQWPSCVGGCQGYEVEAALDAGFGSGVAIANYPNTASQGGVAGLQAGTPYFVRVGSINWDGISNFSAAVATATLIPVESTATVGASGGVAVSVVPGGSPITNIQLIASPGTLAPGVVVTLDTSVGGLPAPVSNEAQITPVAAGLGFTIDAQATQPVYPVQVTMSYDPLLLPPGANARNIVLARYDPSAGQWTLMPTSVDTTQNTATGWVNHFSLFSPFLVTAASSLGGVQVFPVPWEPGGSNTLFNAPVLTFSNLPGGSHVKLMTLSGEFIWEHDAGGNGVLSFDGRNRYGRDLGSGTYIAIITNGGTRILKRVVIIR